MGLGAADDVFGGTVNISGILNSFDLSNLLFARSLLPESTSVLQLGIARITGVFNYFS